MKFSARNRFFAGVVDKTSVLWHRALSVVLRPQQRFINSALLIFAFVLGIWVRARITFSNHFPINDGGLFYSMTKDVLLNGLALPRVSSYNDAGIPFCYPPLAFYLGAVLNYIGLDIAAYEWLAPLLWSALLLLVAYLFAKQLGFSGRGLVYVILALGVHRGVVEWQIMGGGVTRGLGLLLAALSVLASVRVLREPNSKNALLLGIFSSAACLTHLEAAQFAAVGVLSFCIVELRFKQQLKFLCLAALLALALGLPWLIYVARVHGLSALLGTPGIVPYLSFKDLPRSLMILNNRLGYAIFDAYVPWRLVPFMVGALSALFSRQAALLIWFVLEWTVPGRANGAFSALPVALLMGVGFCRLEELASAAAKDLSAQSSARRRSIIAAILLISFVAVGGFMAHLDNLYQLRSVSDGTRADFEWIKENTPNSAAFLVLEDTNWSYAKVSEWFPALALRPNVVVVQGSEWFGKPLYEEALAASLSLGRCALRGARCFLEWQEEHKLDFNFIYVPAEARGAFEPLLRSLEAAGLFRPVREGPGGVVLMGRS